MTKKIPYINLIKQAQVEKKEIFKSLSKIFMKGDFILGDEVDLFEKKICKYLGVNHCVALNSGTDALVLGLHLLGIKRGDEVITPPNSFVASTAAIVHLGAIPVFADVKEDQNIDPKEIEKKITKKTKAIMPVHLSGRSCEMDKINHLSKKFRIPIIEDAAQSIGSKFRGKYVGTFGEVGCFSAHPLKNLNAIGDAGYLVTNNSKIATSARLLRNHGIQNRNQILSFGYVSRMDNLQASILNLRLKKLNEIVKKRRSNANLYFKNLKNIKNLKLPIEKKDEFNTYHTFIIKVKNRDKLKRYLEKKGIGTTIHYPHLIFEQIAYKKRFKKVKIEKYKIAKDLRKKILTLPINQFITSKEIIKICNEIKKFYK